VAAGSPLIKTAGTAAPIYSIYDNNSAKNKRKTQAGKMQMVVAKMQPCATTKEAAQKQNFRNFKRQKPQHK